VDDGSDDESPAIIGSLAAEDSRIRPVFLRKNLGTSASRNIGIEESSGEYVALLDSDDCHLPHTLERMMQSYEEAEKTVSGISLLVSDAYLINEKGVIKGRYMSRNWHGLMTLDRRDGDPATDWKGVNNGGMQLVYEVSPKWCLPSTHFFKRSVPVRFSEKFGIIDPPIFMARMESYGRVIYVGDPLIQYRLKMNSITNLHGEAALRSMEAVSMSKDLGCLDDPIAPDQVPAPSLARIAAWTHGRTAKAAWCNERYLLAISEFVQAFAVNPGDVCKRAMNFFSSK
jgi:glycosyltransferase involved in cell wall biosynthesis